MTDPPAALPPAIASVIAAQARRGGRPLVVGLTGPQGSGKTTLARALSPLLGNLDLRAGVLALDDLYLPKADRLRLAADVHPLLATRGVPGTHDVALGLEVLQSLGQARETQVPSFDKAADDRRQLDQWPRVRGPLDVIVFEGWCVGARPQPAEALAAPVNDLECVRDPNGVWRRYANDALARPYRALFGAVGCQALLVAPGFDVVLGWREQQEHELIAQGGVGQTDAELAVFVQHYERITRWIAAEMPPRADVVVRLGVARDVLSVEP